ncbi:MAG: CoA-binding protein [Treponema sp.]|nr:CoA-binding protein [Treponema sp.]
MEQIPAVTKERLLHLMRILENAGNEFFTSARIEGLTGWSSHTIRRDISHLEAFAACGEGTAEGAQSRLGSANGYAPACLVPLIRRALGLDRSRKYCVVGLGRLGSAYLNTLSSPGGGFELAAGFDVSVNRVEILKSPVPLYPVYKMGEVVSRFGIEIALLCVPAGAAQDAAERLAAAGIRGIINFAPVVLTLAPELAVRNVYLDEELRALAVRM